MKFEKKIKLKKYNTFNLNVKAKAIYPAYSIQEILKFWKMAKINKLPFLLIGNGSNILFIKNFKGIVILNKIKFIKITESIKKWFIHVGSGNHWHKLIKKLMKNKIYGLENMALIPGSVGAAPIQNIGAYGMEFKEVCDYVNITDLRNGKNYRLNKKECKFGYRESVFKKKYKKYFAIISVGIKLNKKWKPKLTYSDLLYLKKKKIKPKYIFKKICEIRKKKIPNPFLIGNAGSFFKNPTISNKKAKKIKNLYPKCKFFIQKNKKLAVSAGWLISKCNIKNIQYGGAAIYKKKPIILINKNNATGKDILNLAKFIYKTILKKFKIKLESEVTIINEKNIIKQSDAFL